MPRLLSPNSEHATLHLNQISRDPIEVETKIRRRSGDMVRSSKIRSKVSRDGKRERYARKAKIAITQMAISSGRHHGRTFLELPVELHMMIVAAICPKKRGFHCEDERSVEPVLNLRWYVYFFRLATST
jgi:hypothetical protein